MCSLRDAAKDFEAVGARVYGISLDDVQSVAAFVKAQELSFPLLSDPDGSVARKFGVLMEGRPFARRVTFVIDGQGTVRLVDEDVDVTNHGSQLVERIRALRQ
ncbi:MAG: peroxiredoxin [Planctomycetota bacterium]